MNTELDKLFLILKGISDELISLNEGVSSNSIKSVERILNVSLPPDFAAFLSFTNGMWLNGATVLPIPAKNESSEKVNIISVRNIEYTEVQNEMPKYFLPSAPDGGGNHYCFDLRKIDSRGFCPVIFWQWNYSFFYPEDIEQTHDNFIDWLKEVINDAEQEIEEITN